MHEIFKLSYYKKTIEWTAVFPSDEDHQVLLVSGLKMHPTDPRWWMAAIWKNCKIAISLQLLDQFR